MAMKNALRGVERLGEIREQLIREIVNALARCFTPSIEQ
jgi:hypothetical protein